MCVCARLDRECVNSTRTGNALGVSCVYLCTVYCRKENAYSTEHIACTAHTFIWAWSFISHAAANDKVSFKSDTIFRNPLIFYVVDFFLSISFTLADISQQPMQKQNHLYHDTIRFIHVCKHQRKCIMDKSAYLKKKHTLPPSTTNLATSNEKGYE